MWYSDKKLNYSQALMNKNEVLELLKFYSRSNILSIIVKREPLTWKIKVFSKNLEQDTNMIQLEKLTPGTEAYLKNNLKGCRNVNFIYGS